MGLRIAIVHDAPSPPWSVRQLIIAAESRGHTALYLRPSNIVSVFGFGETGVFYTSSLSKLAVDAVVLRDLGFTATLESLLRRINVFQHLEFLGIPVVNSVRSLLTARDKYLSLLILSLNGVPVPRTAVVEDANTAMRIASQWGSVVIKPLIGSMGLGAVKTDDPDIVYTIARTLQRFGQPIYIQQYIEKPHRDIRIFVVGDDIVASYYRVQTSSNTWKTNISQGAKPVPMKPDEELCRIALRATKVLGLHYAGVDIAESSEGYVVLEVNASPNWRGLTMATGINPAYHIIDYVVKLVKK